MLRSYFKKDAGDTIRRVWREVMSDEWMKLYTWTGTSKPDSGKQKGLAVRGSRLSLANFEAVKYGDFASLSTPEIEKVTQKNVWICS